MSVNPGQPNRHCFITSSTWLICLSKPQDDFSSTSSVLQSSMAYLFLALLLPELSLQLPHLTLKSSSLQSRAESVYSFDLSRVTPRVAVVDDVSASDSSDPGLIRDVERRSKYLFPITVEGEVFQMEMDTGSSDTWIIRTGFSCYEYYDRSSDIFSEPQPQKVCNFGPTYTPGPGFKINPSIIEKQGYRGGTRYVRGPMGHVSLSIGGVTVQQLIGVPNKVSRQTSIEQLSELTFNKDFLSRIRRTRAIGHAWYGAERLNTSL